MPKCRETAVCGKEGKMNQSAGKRLSKEQVHKKEKEQQLCPVYKKCGGCQLLHMEYKRQLDWKREQVSSLLKPFGKLEGITGMENPAHYRHKVHAVFGRDTRGNAISGVYKEGTHIIVPVDTCLLENEKADAIIKTIRGLLKSFKIKIYDEDTGYGLLRHVLVRVGYETGQIMVVLVLRSPVMPSKNNFVKALRKEHPEITTVVVNVNDRKTSMVLGTKEQVIYGPGYIEDKLCGLTFKISPRSFYQVNPSQTEKLYRKAVEYAELSGRSGAGHLLWNRNHRHDRGGQGKGSHRCGIEQRCREGCCGRSKEKPDCQYPFLSGRCR